MNKDEMIEGAKVMETTTFHFEDEVLAPIPSTTVGLPAGLSTGVVDYKKQDIINFMQRPIQVGNGTISSSLNALSQVQSLQLPQTFLSHRTIKEKVRGFMFFKGTAVITIVINGTRFQQGRLLCTFFPQADLNPWRYSDAKASLTTLTQLPRVEIDVNVDDHVTMEIPWVNTELAFNTNDQTGTQGRFDTYIYEPLTVPTGDNTLEYTIYISYKNVELHMPVVPVGYIAQALKETSRKKNKDPPTQESESDRPLSTSLNLISKLSGLATKVPLLSSVAGPTSWVTGMMANAAYAWGFSKPQIVDKVSPIMQRPMKGAQNTNGFDGGSNLGCFEDNSIQILPGANGTDEDEMSISNLVGRFSYNSRTLWNDTQAAGVHLFSIDCYPESFRYPVGTPNITIGTQTDVEPTCMAPSAFIGQHFRFWRGGFKFRMKFIKTEFHSGRLQVCFYPGNVNNVPTIDDQNYLYKEVVDIRQTTEFEFAVPFVSNSPYLDNFVKSGTVHVTVINELRSPSTVANFIAILTEVAMTSDAEFCVPKPAVYYPYTTNFNKPAIAASSVNWAPQAGIDTKDDKVTTHQLAKEVQPKEKVESLAVATVDNLRYDNCAQYCVGEVIISLRQLMKRHTVWLHPNYLLGDNPVALSLNPRILDMPYVGWVEADDNKAWSRPDYYYMFAGLFNYSRGSIRIKAYPIQESINNSTVRVLRTPYGSDDTFNIIRTEDAAFNLNEGSPAIFTQNTNSTVEVTVPYYNRTHSSINLYKPYGQEEPNYTAPQDGVQFKSTVPNNLTYYNYTRTIADDFSFGFFIGVPLCIASYGLTSTQTDLSTSW